MKPAAQNRQPRLQPRPNSTMYMASSASGDSRVEWAATSMAGAETRVMRGGSPGAGSMHASTPSGPWTKR